MAAIALELGQRVGLLGIMPAAQTRESLFSLIEAGRLHIEVRGSIIDSQMIYVRWRMDRSLGWDRFTVQIGPNSDAMERLRRSLERRLKDT